MVRSQLRREAGSYLAVATRGGLEGGQLGSRGQPGVQRRGQQPQRGAPGAHLRRSMHSALLFLGLPRAAQGCPVRAGETPKERGVFLYLLCH
jgi:hypothetical protein